MNHQMLGVALMLLGLGAQLQANNITVTNVAITNQSSMSKSAMVGLGLRWENSWRVTNGPANWDAAWVFVKFHLGDGNWRHAYLSTNAADHEVPAGVAVTVGITGTNGMGVFLYRNAPGSGSNQWDGIKLKWVYGTQGVPDAALVTVDVAAIEMVYVPEGAFQAGDGSTNSLSSFRQSGGSAPYLVNSEDAITLAADTPGALDFSPTTVYVVNMWGFSSYCQPMLFPPPSGGFGGGGFGTTTVTNQVTVGAYLSPLVVSNAFPKGYRAFYIMKYEVSWAQYNDYANKRGLGTSGGNNERAWTLLVSGPEVDQVGPVLSYLDWTGLRPLTELEYEKACRGPVSGFPDEYAWGNPYIAFGTYTVANPDAFNATITANYETNGGNAWYSLTSYTNGVTCRVGIFARPSYAAGASARVQSGAGYYGAMELTANAGELYMLVQNDGNIPSPFDGAHGSGGVATPSSWSAHMILRGDGIRPAPSEYDGALTSGVWPSSVSHRFANQGTNQLFLYKEYCWTSGSSIDPPSSTNFVGYGMSPGIRGGRTAP